MTFAWLLVGLLGCPDGTGKGEDPDTGPCDPSGEPKEQDPTALDTATFDDDADGSPKAVVWVDCADADTTDPKCERLLFNAGGSVGTQFEWWMGRGQIGSDATLEFDAADAQSPITLAVRDPSAPGKCDGLSITTRILEYQLQSAAAPRVIVTPLWIAGTTSRPSGCNFTAGIGGCITDPAVHGYRVEGSSVSATGTASDLRPASYDLKDPAANDKGFAVWSAWDYAQANGGTANTGSLGTLPKAMFPIGSATASVTVNGVRYTDYLLLGWSINKGASVSFEQTKTDGNDTVTEAVKGTTQCSSSGSGTTVFQ